jgi:phytoene dehydrogenase-like protein
MEFTDMKHDAGKIIIIGGGIAGLCAAVYAQRCGYQAEVLEMHDSAGGLATSWRRGAYTFETCLHWLFGSNPDGEMYSQFDQGFLWRGGHGSDVGSCSLLFSGLDE